MSLEDRQKIFDEYFDSTYKQVNIFTEEQSELSFCDYQRRYKGYLPEDKDTMILDVGCGCGNFLYYLKKQGYRNFFGIDISVQQIEYCKKNISENVTHANAMDFLKDKQEVYGVMAANDVLEHIPKDEMSTFLKLIYRALKKDGIFIARVPNMSNPFGLDARYNDFTHEVGFTSKSLYQLFWSIGFRKITILPPADILVVSFRNFVRKILVDTLHKFMKFLYYIQDYSVPENLDKNLIVIVKKE